jgi:hypothetical protein
MSAAAAVAVAGWGPPARPARAVPDIESWPPPREMRTGGGRGGYTVFLVVLSAPPVGSTGYSVSFYLTCTAPGHGLRAHTEFLSTPSIAHTAKKKYCKTGDRMVDTTDMWGVWRIGVEITHCRDYSARTTSA